MHAGIARVLNTIRARSTLFQTNSLINSERVKQCKSSLYFKLMTFDDHLTYIDYKTDVSDSY